MHKFSMVHKAYCEVCTYCKECGVEVVNNLLHYTRVKKATIEAMLHEAKSGG